MAVAPERGGSSAAAEGVVPTGLRRVPAREGKEGVACRVGSSTFLRHCDVVGVVIISFSSLLPPPPPPLLLLALLLVPACLCTLWSSSSLSSPFFRYPPLRGGACCSSPSSSFRSARLDTLLRRYPPCFDPSSYPSSFVRSLAVSHGFRGREISPSTIAHACTLVPSFSLFPFLPLRIGKQSARCLLSSHSTCLLTQASCPRSISLLSYARNSRNDRSRKSLLD